MKYLYYKNALLLAVAAVITFVFPLNTLISTLFLYIVWLFSSQVCIL